RAGAAANAGPCVNPRNPHSATPALRALFVALEQWVTEGREPPASRVPSLADGSGVKAASVRLPRVPGFAHPPGDNRVAAPVDWAAPPEDGPAQFYETFVAAVDSDGNEVAGIR